MIESPNREAFQLGPEILRVDLAFERRDDAPAASLLPSLAAGMKLSIGGCTIRLAEIIRFRPAHSTDNSKQGAPLPADVRLEFPNATPRGIPTQPALPGDRLAQPRR